MISDDSTESQKAYDDQGEKSEIGDREIRKDMKYSRSRTRHMIIGKDMINQYTDYVDSYGSREERQVRGRELGHGWEKVRCKTAKKTERLILRRIGKANTYKSDESM
jgi:hypothetical protein